MASSTTRVGTLLPPHPLSPRAPSCPELLRICKHWVPADAPIEWTRAESGWKFLSLGGLFPIMRAQTLLRLSRHKPLGWTLLLLPEPP